MSGYVLRCIVFLSLVLLVFCLVFPTLAASTWDVQTVDVTSEGIVNGDCPIALDSNNNPHIFYTGCYVYNENNRYYDFPTAMYAKWNGSSWRTQQIALGTTFDIKLDTNDNPHILYSLSVYSRWTGWRGSNWVNETITRNRVLFASLALDSEDNPHIAYTDGQSVKYANWNDSNWNIQTIDTISEIPNSVFIALDSNNTPYIMYCNPSSYQDNRTGIGYSSIIVKCAVWKNSSWSIENVLDSYNLGDYGNLVMDSKGYPHFVCAQYHRVSPENTTLLYTILYASWDGTEWATQTVVENVRLIEDSWARTIGFVSLDPSDYPHFCYLAKSYEIIYTGWTGTAWNTHTVNTTIPTRGPYYLAMDSNGNSHISFRGKGPGQSFNDVGTHIMYATMNNTVPEGSQPTLPVFENLPLVLVTITLSVGAVMLLVYVWKRKPYLSKNDKGEGLL